MEEDSLACTIPHLFRALDLRKKYMRISKQNKSWREYGVPAGISAVKKDSHWVLVNDDVAIPSVAEYHKDLEFITSIIHNGPLKSFCYQRLEHLELQFKIHLNQSHGREKKEQRTLSNRDFYTVFKADTHLHHSASMNSKKLLKYIKKKLRDSPEDEVYRDKAGEVHTLSNIFSGINKTVDTLCLDSLGTHSNLETFHRFDRFNSKYNPYGTPILREVFLKHDNFIQGKYLAELTQELIEEVEEKEYLKCEWGVSLYGKKEKELEVLSTWVHANGLYSRDIRWYLQVPRLYGVFKGYGNIGNYAEFLCNVFSELIEASQRPKAGTADGADAHSVIDRFLDDVVGIDSVDDEGVKDKRSGAEKDHPSAWSRPENPPYSLYMYYMYYYVSVANRLRASRGKNLLCFRPHSGESGDPDHLAAAFLCAKSIAHGVKLRKSPVLQYLYYLAQIGIAMSPLSNNSLFIEYRKNPFPMYFYRGLNVSLSTDDPLQFHYTREPLMEEYSIASQIWKLSSCDQCEIARNSVLLSNFPREEKEKWIGKYEENGRSANDHTMSNVPPTRFQYRMNRISEEYEILEKYASRPGLSASREN
ncbi:AMP deaminase [Nematocida major]|uniref:AMP deaminase n=1 Tax=Nematocida major TaxID=1912982 RepID=UPI002007B62F|nr:AMP deaminase [Nematocida major]KAH9385531.1 AMP deaminase [Nematocida major]